MKTILLIFLSFFSVTIIFAQGRMPSPADTNLVLPIRTNGLWGFINQKGSVVNSPQYDGIMPKTANVWGGKFDYFLVEKSQKLGMVDDYGNEILQPIFDEELKVIQRMPLTFSIPFEHGVMPVNGEGKHLLNDVYDEVRPINDNYFAVRKGDKWGIHQREGALTLAVKYYGFDFNFTKYGNYGKGFFIYYGDKNKKTVGLVNKDGKVIIPARFLSLKFINDDYILVNKSKSNSEIFDFRGKTTGIKCVEAFNFTNNILRIRQNIGYYRLYYTPTKKWITPDFKYKMFVAGKGKYIISEGKNRLKGVIDTTGKLILNPQYNSVQVFNPNNGLFKIYKNGVWGIANSQNKRLLKLKYQAIGNLDEGNLARLICNSKYGLVNHLGEIVVPAEYDEITTEGGQIVTRRGSSVTTFEASSDGKLTKIREDNNVFTLRIGYKDSRAEMLARGNRRTRNPVRIPNRADNVELVPDNSLKNNLKIYKKDELLGFKDANSEAIVLEAQFPKISRIQNTNIAFMEVRRDASVLGFDFVPSNLRTIIICIRKRNENLLKTI